MLIGVYVAIIQKYLWDEFIAKSMRMGMGLSHIFTNKLAL